MNICYVLIARALMLKFKRNYTFLRIHTAFLGSVEFGVDLALDVATSGTVPFGEFFNVVFLGAWYTEFRDSMIDLRFLNHLCSITEALTFLRSNDVVITSFTCPFPLKDYKSH